MGLTPEQLALRLTGIASSDIAAACDLYPASWKSRRGPADVIAEKLGDAPPWEGNARTKRGEWLEPVIAAKWSEETGRAVERNVGQTFRHPSIEWALATPDYFIVGPPREILEVKLVGQFSAKDWKDAPPLYYVAQVQWQLGCLGLKSATVAALHEGDKDEAGPRKYPIQFDQTSFTKLVFLANQVWQRVLSARAERAKGVSNG